MDPLQLVQETSLPINKAGDAFYFDPATLAKGKELGLDGFRFYFLGRGGVLGDVEPAVVQSAFGYFAGPVVAKIWNSAKERMEPRAAAKAYLECAADLGRAKLGDVDGLDAFNDAAETVIQHVHPGGLALFAAVAAEPLPDDAPGRAYRNIVNLRELRGSLHLVAVIAAGLDPAKAHLIKRPDDFASFGYEETPEIGEADRAAHAGAEAQTDVLMAAAFDVLSDDQRDALSAGTAAIAAATT